MKHLNKVPNKELALQNYKDYQSVIDWISESNEHPVNRSDSRFMIKSIIMLSIYNNVWYNKNYNPTALIYEP